MQGLGSPDSPAPGTRGTGRVFGAGEAGLSPASPIAAPPRTTEGAGGLAERSSLSAGAFCGGRTDSSRRGGAGQAGRSTMRAVWEALAALAAVACLVGAVRGGPGLSMFAGQAAQL